MTGRESQTRGLLWIGPLLVVACRAAPEPDPSALTMQLADDAEASFWALPFPLDSRRTDLGTIDLATFPNPGGAPIVETYLRYAEAEMRGFGLATPIWLPFDGTLALPTWDRDAAAASGRCEGPVRVIDIDPTSPRRGRCVPARWSQRRADDGDPFLAPHLVSVQPIWGFPLRPGTVHAVVLVDVTDEAAAPVLAGPSLLAAFDGAGPHGTAFAPLVDFWAEDPTRIGTTRLDDDGAPDVRAVAGATVFTTEDTVSELGRLIDHARSDTQGPVWDGVVLPVAEDHPEHQNEYRMVETSYEAWNYQRGVVPYSDEGGGFLWEPDGAPIPQRRERIPVAISLPNEEDDVPAEGWPVVLHQHGTGGDRWSHLTGGPLRPGLALGRRGFLSIGIPQPIHDDRWPERTSTGIELYSFNYLNPESGRSMFRQGAVDLASLLRFVQEQMVDGGALASAHPDLRIDPQRIYFLGHSQGGLTGALALPFLDDIRAWVLSGAGGGTAMTMMQREDPFVIRDTLYIAAGSPEGAIFTDDHPLFALVQMMAETTDPLVYAPQWNSEGTAPRSILLTEGLFDAQTPADTAEALACAGGLPMVEPWVERGALCQDLAGLHEGEAPLSGNGADGEATLGLAQFDADHFVIFQDGDASILWSNFLLSHASEGAPGTIGWEP